MGLWVAAPFLVAASLRNRVRAQVKRLKNPRYLIGAAVGLFYLWTVFFRRMFRDGGGFDTGGEGIPPEILLLIEGLMVLGGLMVITSAWVFGSNSRSALRYSEAEIQFFFAGPVTRRQILHYKLLRTLLQTLASALITTLLFGRSLAGSPAYFIVGSFLALGSIALHVTGASLTRDTLGKHGRYGLAHRGLTLLAVVAVVGGFAWWGLVTSKPLMPDAPDKEAWLAYLRALTHSGPLDILLWPLRAPVAVALAQDGQTFLRALPGGLLVLAANYLWVMFSDHAFEESAVQHSERFARRVEAYRSGRQPQVLEAKPFRLKLAATGRPEVALAWKALAGVRRLIGFGLIPLVMSVVIMCGLLVFTFLRDREASLTLGAAAVFAVIALLTALIGPTTLPIDLRKDIQHLEILKSWPLSGRQVVVGELLGPFAVLTLSQWFCWLVALVLGLAPVADIPVTLRVAVVATGMIAGPALTAITLVLVNVAVLLFPAWVSHEPRRGIEATGQRILTLAGGLLVLGIGILPATVVGGGVLFLFGGVLQLGAGALPIAAVFAAAVLFAEVALAVVWMGRLYDGLDLTE